MDGNGATCSDGELSLLLLLFPDGVPTDREGAIAPDAAAVEDAVGAQMR